MKSKTLLANLVLFGALAVAVPVFAKPMSANFPLTHSVRVGQTEVKAGNYRFLIDGTHLTVLNGKKQVAESEGRWEDREAKSPYSEIVSTTDGQLRELRFAGKRSVFILPH